MLHTPSGRGPWGGRPLPAYRLGVRSCLRLGSAWCADIWISLESSEERLVSCVSLLQRRVVFHLDTAARLLKIFQMVPGVLVAGMNRLRPGLVCCGRLRRGCSRRWGCGQPCWNLPLKGVASLLSAAGLGRWIGRSSPARPGRAAVGLAQFRAGRVAEYHRDRLDQSRHARTNGLALARLPTLHVACQTFCSSSALAPSVPATSASTAIRARPRHSRRGGAAGGSVRLGRGAKLAGTTRRIAASSLAALRA